MAIDPTSASNSNTSTGGAKNPTQLQDLDSTEFLKLLISELSNQDPLDPVKNSELVQQVSTIRQISATSALEDSLQAVTTSQNLASASSLIGKNVKALSDSGGDVTGVVTKATVQVDPKTDARTFRIQIGTNSVQLKNVREVID